MYNRVKDSRLVYKHYATLYFVLVFDGSENELAMLDLIQAALFLYLFVYHYCSNQNVIKKNHIVWFLI